MGVIMLALGVWEVFQRAGALRQGMFLAAALLAMVSSQSLSLANLQLLITASALTQSNIPNQNLLGLGQSVLYVGLFFAASAGISVLLTRDRQPAT